ncbi:mucin-22-like [Rhopilema esculentum]|uniref:mucin-22-like n=1 Tax=Rhopilema esculentum TaxID=499914 RepID=UPI0031D121C1
MRARWKNFMAVMFIYCFIHYSSAEENRDLNKVTDNKGAKAEAQDITNEEDKTKNSKGQTSNTNAHSSQLTSTKLFTKSTESTVASTSHFSSGRDNGRPSTDAIALSKAQMSHQFIEASFTKTPIRALQTSLSASKPTYSISASAFAPSPQHIKSSHPHNTLTASRNLVFTTVPVGQNLHVTSTNILESSSRIANSVEPNSKWNVLPRFASSMNSQSFDSRAELMLTRSLNGSMTNYNIVQATQSYYETAIKKSDKTVSGPQTLSPSLSDISTTWLSKSSIEILSLQTRSKAEKSHSSTNEVKLSSRVWDIDTKANGSTTDSTGSSAMYHNLNNRSSTIQQPRNISSTYTPLIKNIASSVMTSRTSGQSIANPVMTSRINPVRTISYQTFYPDSNSFALESWSTSLTLSTTSWSIASSPPSAIVNTSKTSRMFVEAITGSLTPDNAPSSVLPPASYELLPSSPNAESLNSTPSLSNVSTQLQAIQSSFFRTGLTASISKASDVRSTYSKFSGNYSKIISNHVPKVLQTSSATSTEKYTLNASHTSTFVLPNPLTTSIGQPRASLVAASSPISSTLFSVNRSTKAIVNSVTSAVVYSPSKTSFFPRNVTPTLSFVTTSYFPMATSSYSSQLIDTARHSAVTQMTSTSRKSSLSKVIGETTISTHASIMPVNTSKSQTIKSVRFTANIARSASTVNLGSSSQHSSKPSSKTTKRSTVIHAATSSFAKRQSTVTMDTTSRISTALTTATTSTATTIITASTLTPRTTSKTKTTWPPTTEGEPVTDKMTTSKPVFIGVPEIHTKKLDSYPTAVNIEFHVVFPGIQEAYKLQIVAQRHGHLIFGGADTLRTWYEVRYFEDYKYDSYVAGEYRKKSLVHRSKFNFTFGQEIRCEKEQIRYEHCNGPLEKGSYRFQLQYHVHGSIRKSAFSKVYTTAAIKTTAADDQSTGLNQSSITIAVIAVLAILLVLIIVIAIVLYRRKNNNQSDPYGETEVSECTLLTSLKRTSSCSKSCYGRGTLGGADSSVMLKHLTKGMSRPVHLKDFISWVNRSQADSDFRFAEEFESIRDVGRDQSHEASDIPENRGKNRYVNVLAYDKTRVKLSYTDDEIGSDYINASYVHGYKHPRAYIATQGPLPGTTDDFWRMIWEQNTFNIVMATQCMERNRVKCHQYWPGTQPTAYGDIVVSLLSEVAYPDWIEREFLLEVEDEGSRNIKHFQYVAWPDHGVPKNASTVLDFIHTVRSHILPRQGPLVVHCSAGVGRTGTLIAIDIIMDRLQDEDTIDVYLTLCMMRIQRCNMVQTEDQYIFIHRVIVDYLRSRDPALPFKGYSLLPKNENEEGEIDPDSDSPTANRDSGLALLLSEYDTERAEDAVESVA